MAYDFLKLKKKAEDVKAWFKEEMGSLRTGRATPAIVENIMVESYGAKTPLKHVASISVSDARTLLITPWDASQLKGIESALSQADLGAQPIADKQSVRLSLPSLTEERRNLLIKTAGERLEKARISLRLEREEVWRDIQAQEKDGLMSEDEKFRYKDEMQKIIDATTRELEMMVERKEEEIRQ